MGNGFLELLEIRAFVRQETALVQPYLVEQLRVHDVTGATTTNEDLRHVGFPPP